MKISSRFVCSSTTAVVLAWYLQSASAATNLQQDECRDSLHHNCALILESDECDGFTKGGEIFGETFCRASCGRCDVDDNSVSADNDCYSFGKQEITLSFHNMEPRQDDWIGIYEEADDDEDLGDLVNWYWLCGNKRDHCLVAAGSVTFPWLPPGTYRAILSRNEHHSKGPYPNHAKNARYAESTVFEVVRGDSCASRRMEDVKADSILNDSQNGNLRGLNSS